MVIEPGNSGINRNHANSVNNSGNRVKGASQSAGDSSNASAPANTDSVSLSQQAQAMGRLEAAVNQAPEVDESKVESLRQAIANGSYTVDSQSVAQKMLSNESQF